MRHSDGMRRIGALMAVVTAVAVASGPALAKKSAVAPTPSQPVTIELPDSDAVLPDRPKAEVVDRNCLSCHSVEMIENQPALPRTVWAAEIDKMRTVFGAHVAPGDIDDILDYLMNLHGETRRTWR